MRFFNKKGMVMGPLEHSMLLKHLLPVSVSWRKCLTPMKSALSKTSLNKRTFQQVTDAKCCRPAFKVSEIEACSLLLQDTDSIISIEEKYCRDSN